jgi:hypothetical protein
MKKPHKQSLDAELNATRRQRRSLCATRRSRSSRRIRIVALGRLLGVVTFISVLWLTADPAMALETPVTGSVTAVTATSATFHGVLNPLHKSTQNSEYNFAYRASSTECGGVGEENTPGLPAAGHSPEAVEATVTNLLPDTSYTFCVREVTFEPSFEEVKGLPVSFMTPTAAPAISGETALGVGATGATVGALIGPGALSTLYHVEYVTEAQFDAHGWSEATRVPSPDAELAAARGGVSVREELGGLQPGTVYRFRFVASNSRAEAGVVGKEAKFATAPAGAPTSGSGLPDGRVYELVSTSGNVGEVYVPFTSAVGGADISTQQPFQAAAGGDAVAYMGEPAATGGSGATGSGEGNQWLATRTSSGWVTTDVTPESETGTAYLAFSPDLSTGFLETSVQPPLASDAPPNCQVLYSRTNGSGAYSSLFTATQVPGSCGHPDFAGASAGDTHVIFQSEAALTSNAQAAELPPGHQFHDSEFESVLGEPCVFGCNLYDSENGVPRLVNILPEGMGVPNATFGGYASANKPDFSNAISADGSHVFWTDTQAGPNFEHVYVRENGMTTAQVSGAAPAQYWTATPDGRYAFYTEGGNLWRFDTASKERTELAGPGAGVLGVIGINTSEEGEQPGVYVYFVALAALAGNAHGGEPNLYLLHGGTVSYIATLATSDNELIANAVGEATGDWVPNLGERTAEVTPDGRHLVFESTRSLTGYDNVNTITHEGAVEVFVYDATTERLACASCNPLGAAPQLELSEEQKRTLLPVSFASDTYMRRWISGDGRRVFFESVQPLVAADSNGVKDVYEWEQEGASGCPVATSLFGGCVYLLSGGSSDDASYFVDADATGENVFFTHRGQLGDVTGAGGKTELYDARVGGGFSQTSLACTGTGCQGVPPAPPIFAEPASATFAGGGNYLPSSPPAKAAARTLALTRARRLAKALAACKRQPRKRRLVCDRQARRRYGTKTKPRTRAPRRMK